MGKKKDKAHEKKQFLKLIQDLRAMIRSGKHAECPCLEMKCEWHGRCFECVMIHRVYRKHVPECLQPVIEEKIEQLARSAELTVRRERHSMDELWDYVNKVSPPKP